jgi:hypothetical protein
MKTSPSEACAADALLPRNRDQYRYGGEIRQRRHELQRNWQAHGLGGSSSHRQPFSTQGEAGLAPGSLFLASAISFRCLIAETERAVLHQCGFGFAQ